MRARSDCILDIIHTHCTSHECWGGRVMRWCWVNFQCRGVLLIWFIVGQGHNALAVGAGGACLDILSRLSFLVFLPISGRRPID